MANMRYKISFIGNETLMVESMPGHPEIN